MNQQELVQRVVAEVLSQLSARSAAAPAVAPVRSGEVVSEVSAAIAITDRVVTEKLLADRLSGKAIQRLAICPKAIVTPSARDWLRTNRIDWHRNTAEVSLDPAKPVTKWNVILLSTTSAVVQAVEDVEKQSFGKTWKREAVITADQAVSSATKALNQDGVRGVVIFARQAEVVTCKACRNERINAAVVNDAGGVAELKTIMNLNLMVVNPEGKGFFEIQNLLRAFARGG